MKVLRYHSDAGEGAGAEAGSDDGGAAGDAAAQSVQDPGSQAAGSLQDDAGKVDFEAFYKQNKEKVTTVDGLSDEVSKLKKKLGQQGEQVGAYNHLRKAMNENPSALIQEIAKNANLKVNMEQSNVDFSTLTGTDGEVNVENLPNLLKQMEQNIMSNARRELLPRYEEMFTAQLAGKYDDWDDLTETRDLLQLNLTSKKMSYAEVLHLASQGVNMSEALNAAKANAKVEYAAELKEKADATLPTDGSGGESHLKSPAGHDPKDKDYFTKVVKGMRSMPPS